MRMFAQAFGSSAGMFSDFGFSNGGRDGGAEIIFDDPFAAFHGGGHSAPRRQKQDPTVQHELPVSLEDICNGCTKKMKITRLLLFNENFFIFFYIIKNLRFYFYKK